MHAAIWKFSGQPDELLRSYDAVIAQRPPGSLGLHMCLRAPDGIIIIDTCPTREAFEALIESEEFRALRESQGMPEPDAVEDHPVHAAFVEGAAVQ